MKKSNSKINNPNQVIMRKGEYQWEVAFGRGRIKPQHLPKLPIRREISIHRHIADLQIKMLSKETFKRGVEILRSLMQDRYSSASRSEQYQLYFAVSRVATILTSQFTGKEFWRVGLSLFKVAKKVITKIDELMHICACINLSRTVLGDDQKRKQVVRAIASVSKSSSSIIPISKYHVANHQIEIIGGGDGEENKELSQFKLQEVHDFLKPILNTEDIDPYKEEGKEDEQEEERGGGGEVKEEEEKKNEELSSLLIHSKESKLELEPNDAIQEVELEFPQVTEDFDMRFARTLTMEELSMEIQAILFHINQSFASRGRILGDEFASLQEAIQATLQEINNTPQGPPPASKEEIEKLPIVVVTKGILTSIGEGTQCVVCRESLLEGDVMQEMPCLHHYHRQCLTPWLEKHNSCPICRFELRTKDEQYEQQEKQAHEAKGQRSPLQIFI